MAVEARRLTLFPPHELITNRDLLNSNEGTADLYNTQMGSGVPFAATTLPETLFAFPQSLVFDPVPVMKADSGVTYNVPAASRKRSSRESSNQITNFIAPQESNNLSEWSSFLGEEIPLQIHQQQFEIDRIVTEHTKKMRLEVGERQKQHSRALISAMGERLVKKMKEKDEQIQRMGKLNWALQERVKSLYVENQLWRDLAQTNEATANSLRNNLQQVLAHVSDSRPSPAGCGGGGGQAAAADEDDAESCCGSSDHGRDRMEKEEEVAVVDGGFGGGGVKRRLCRQCGERESSVLVLPCRHLCLCNLCGSTLHHTCPVCNSHMNGSLHVNMMSS